MHSKMLYILIIYVCISIDVFLFSNVIYPICAHCSAAVTYYHENQLDFGHLKRNPVHNG